MLPITKHKEEITSSVSSHYVTIITGETGSGKSTQVPKYLADHFQQVIVTEPRVMAAKTLAQRVAEEMDVTIGQEVGYRTCYDKCSSFDSRILYCTDGLQLIRTLHSKVTTTSNVLTIDEVHEQSLNTEVLLAWCKFMKDKWNTKVAIMSATLETESLANFFGEDTQVVNVPGTLYDVKIEERPEYDLIPTICQKISENKNILVFTTGKKEIKEIMDELPHDQAVILPLHGEMDWVEQQKCFASYSKPKVIVATNVAQTSLTIPDIDVVVDSGKAKISIARNGIQGLYEVDISQADIKQRAGRAGRTKDGEYFLCSDTPISFRDEYPVPEIQRSLLDRVVLQLSAIGLDAEKLEFFHQPDKEEIARAKKQLVGLGALTPDYEITQLGQKMVRIPLEPYLARMVIEAENYGVVEEVLKIAAIIQMGGLLDKEGAYCSFSAESRSDLLAELDVWNSITKMGYIEFDKLGIRKKNFFKIKEHINKLHEVLYGIVEFSNGTDRNAILNSCIVGLVNHIYVCNGDRDFLDEDRSSYRLDNKSCLFHPKFVVGKPFTYNTKVWWGGTRTTDIIKFATEIDVSTLWELVPNSIKHEVSLRYSLTNDAVEVTTEDYFAGIFIGRNVTYEKDHPDYERLKTEYERQAALIRESHTSFGYNSVRDSFFPDNRQSVVTIDGKVFDVHGYDKLYIHIDDETLFTTNVNEVFLDNGNRVLIAIFSSHLTTSYLPTIQEARNRRELQLISTARKSKSAKYDLLKVQCLDDVLQNSDKIGKVLLTMSNGGYGDTSIFAFGALQLKKATVSFKLMDDEELAKSSTKEALEHLFMKEVSKQYGDNKFSHQEGKKKKVLTDSERKVKSDFDSFVREILRELTIENASEGLELLSEYYSELMQK